LEQAAIAAQTAYLEEDPRVGVIQEWLDHTGYNRVCAIMLWREALGHEYDDPRPMDVNALHEIMKNNVTGWMYVGKQRAGSGYGLQRCYDRKQVFIDSQGHEIAY
jgi:hypothetical protein